MSKTEPITLKLYAVRSKVDGKWYKSRGQRGYGVGRWVDEPSDAKWWAKPGPAKAQVTFFAKNYPEYGTPDLIELVAGEIQVIDQTKRVRDALGKKAEVKARREEKQAKIDLQRAEREAREATARYEQLRQGK